MNETEFGELQIYSVEQDGHDGGVCIARVIAGIVRTGQSFAVEAGDDPRRFTADRIEKYGRPVDFMDPPHSVLVHLSGGPLTGLGDGDVLVCRPDVDDEEGEAPAHVRAL
ncbi:hypothetical protein [Streptomyces narbonensis]|uniref:hypothetical protein n=1 Tax=Streptomyces narbonensis TaxID=67333 RepID=UPI00167A8017|nr:hypothetical protein [Streptomyces narbonensis]GGW01834.1 hypothetical protein GCM10010230_33290 [Streptomyces narbonensis]